MSRTEGRFLYTNAGHNPPILVTGIQRPRLEVGGVVLGLFEPAIFEQETLTLATATSSWLQRRRDRGHE